MQNDNVVVEAGKDCASQGLFTNSSGQVGQCIAGSAAFTYIGIGNGTITGGGTHVGAANQTLADAADNPTGNCSTATDGGELGRRNVTATFDTSSTNTVVTLDTSGKPFTFDASNATTVIDSGIFNNNYAGTVTDGKCPQAHTVGTDWNMFSRQLLNGENGITVSSGDSLSVKWIITVG